MKPTITITNPNTDALATLDDAALARVAGGNGKKVRHAVGNAAAYGLTGESSDEVAQQRVRDSVMRSGQRAIVRPHNGATGAARYGGFQGLSAPGLGADPNAPGIGRHRRTR